MRGDQQQVGQVAPSLDKRFTPSYHQVLFWSDRQMWETMLSVKVVNLGDLPAERRQSISETTDSCVSRTKLWRKLWSALGFLLTLPDVLSTNWELISGRGLLSLHFQNYVQKNLTGITWDCRMFCTILVSLSNFSTIPSSTSTYPVGGILQLISAGIPATWDILAELHL